MKKGVNERLLSGSVLKWFGCTERMVVSRLVKRCIKVCAHK